MVDLNDGMDMDQMEEMDDGYGDMEYYDGEDDSGDSNPSPG